MIFNTLIILALFFQQGDLSTLNSSSLPQIEIGKDNVNLEIIGGNAAAHKQFPYQIYMFALTDPQNNYGTTCGGTILNEYTILTAAHCVVDEDKNMIFNPNIVEIFVGIENKRDAFSNSGIKAKEISVHPNYRVNSNYHDDIAIIKLQKPIQFNDGVQKACLDYSERQYGYLTISGFGQTKGAIRTRDSDTVIEPGTNSDILLYAYVKENRNGCDTINHICTVPYYSNKITDTCRGDSGGPLTNPYGKVVGIVSTGNYVNLDANRKTECLGHSQFTRISRYSNYINLKVGTGNYCATFN